MFTKTLSPRISETNLAKHVGHHVIPIWFEEGFIEILRMFKENINDDPCLAMVNQNIDYIHEIYLGTDVEITTAVKTIGKSSFVLQNQIFQGDKLCAQGTGTFIHFDYAGKKAQPIPADVRVKLERHLLYE